MSPDSINRRILNWSRKGWRVYGDIGQPHYTRKGCPVVMFRKRQRVRWVSLRTGCQVGPEQSNVVPAICFAMHYGWQL